MKFMSNIILGGQVNSIQLQNLANQRLTKYKKFLDIPQLKNVMGIISSSVIVMKPETLHRSKASKQHHLVVKYMILKVKL